MTTLSQRSVRSRPSAIMFIFSIALRGVPRLDGRSTTNRTTRNPLEQPHRALLVKDMSARQQHRPLRLAKLRHADGALVNAYADAAEFLLDLALARHPARVALHQPDGERGELGGGGGGRFGRTEESPMAESDSKCEPSRSSCATSRSKSVRPREGSRRGAWGVEEVEASAGGGVGRAMGGVPGLTAGLGSLEGWRSGRLLLKLQRWKAVRCEPAGLLVRSGWLTRLIVWECPLLPCLCWVLPSPTTTAPAPAFLLSLPRFQGCPSPGTTAGLAEGVERATLCDSPVQHPPFHLQR